MLTNLSLILVSFFPAIHSGELKPHVVSYIDMYKFVAIDEMERSGIPASITLAQAIIESDAGNSKLARASNNHFGIKCKEYWQGPTYYHPDDDRDASGKIIPSCFRQYASVEESYRDHTDFLQMTLHYQGLFGYNRTDYKNWANGLQLCGYATDCKYADKLIQTIERYNLHEYDLYTVQYVKKSELDQRADIVVAERK